jgi:hypothetical protein
MPGHVLEQSSGNQGKGGSTSKKSQLQVVRKRKIDFKDGETPQLSILLLIMLLYMR